MAKRSAGILMFSLKSGGLRVLLVHPGGPFWRNRDEGAWTIPKGEHDAAEAALACARREFREELGYDLRSTPDSAFTALGDIRQKAGKTVTAFACAGEFDPASLKSNLFEVEWPPRSGRRASFPEVDRAHWFTVVQARDKINPAQAPLLDRLVAHLGL